MIHRNSAWHVKMLFCNPTIRHWMLEAFVFLCLYVHPFTGWIVSFQNKEWRSVPQFGGWDQKTATPDYSMVFSKARANKKHNKAEFRPSTSLGTEEEFMVYQRYKSNESTKVRNGSSLLHFIFFHYLIQISVCGWYGLFACWFFYTLIYDNYM